MIAIQFEKPGEYMLEDTQEGYVLKGGRVYGKCKYEQSSDTWTLIDNPSIVIKNSEIDGFSSRIVGFDT